MNAPVPVVVVGAGRVARAVHLRLLPDLPDVLTLAAVVDTDPARTRALARLGLPTATDLAGAVRAGARAAICATPWVTHAAVVADCLDRGLPVLCEKPVSLDPADVAALRERELATGLRVAVGYMKRHDPVVTRFVGLARDLRAEARLIDVRVVDPNAPHQVGHLVPPGELGPPAAPVSAGDRVVRAMLGVHTDPDVRTAYAHGLGGSLIHHVNLVNAIVDASDAGLTGRLRHVSQWDGGRSVTACWEPSPRLAVRMCHVRVPRHRRYRESVELVTDSGWARLRLPSPYSRDDGAVLDTELWDDGAALLRRASVRAATGQTGFVVQLRRWAATLHGDPGVDVPGLADAARDLAVVREAAAVLCGAATRAA